MQLLLTMHLKNTVTYIRKYLYNIIWLKYEDKKNQFQIIANKLTTVAHVSFTNVSAVRLFHAST